MFAKEYYSTQIEKPTVIIRPKVANFDFVLCDV